MKQRGFADDFIIKRLCQFTSRTAEMCAAANYAVLFWRPGSSTKFMCFFPQRTHLFSGSNTVPMLIWCFKHAWFRSFRSINPATAGGLSGFICRWSGFIARLLLFKEFIWFMMLNSAIFKFNSTNARILLLYPYLLNITLWVGLTETDESSFWQAWCTYRKRGN